MIFDTDVLIWCLRGNTKAADAIDAGYPRQVSIVTHMELLQGARNKKESMAVARLMAEFQILPLTAEIGFRARTYMEQFSIGHSLGMADALIAATAIDTQAPLCTGNTKHFRMIHDLDLKSFRPN